MRIHLGALCLGLVVIGSGAAPAVTFDFEYFPDSAGCSQPVPVADGPQTYCDPDWAQEWNAGVIQDHEHTVDGLTLNLTTRSNLQAGGDGGGYIDWGFIGAVINCGNTPDCSPYVADFSLSLVAVQVDLLGVLNLAGSGTEHPDPLTFYLQAFAGANATGDLLGEIVVDATLGPATLALTAPGGSVIRSIAFGATTVDTGGCGPGGCSNLGIADNLIATVPEPTAAALLVLGTLALALYARSHRSRARYSA